MLFHVRRQPLAQEGPGAHASFEFSTNRMMMGFGLGILLFVLAFVAFKAGWSDGSTSLLHLAETVFGGIIGAMVGEHAAVAALRTG